MEFRRCASWPDYEISEDGMVRGKASARKPYLTTTGYLYIVMRTKYAKKACAIHRLVAEAFIGPFPIERPYVAHWDGDKTNNHYTNLRYVTRAENEADKLRHGLSNRGERFGRSRLKELQVIEIKRRLAAGIKPIEIAPDYDVAVTTIKSIKSGKSWFWLSAETGGAE